MVTNSLARDQFFIGDGRGERFPSFVRFYRELEGTARLRTFDPAAWGGKGPILWVYDITRPLAPGQPPLPDGATAPPVDPEELD